MRARQRAPRVVALIAAIALAGVVATSAAGAQTHRQSSGQSSGSNDNPRTINVVGTGVVRGTPDVLELSIGVSTRAKSAGEALSRNNELSNKLNGVLKDAGVDEKDIQTSNLSIAPIYDDNGENVIAYGVDNTVTVKIRDLEKAGKIVDSAAAVAGDEIVVNSLAFSFDDNSELVAQARTEAVKRGKAQAEQLAKDFAGVTGLRELDLPQTQVSDRGLAHLAELTSLRKLWDRGTYNAFVWDRMLEDADTEPFALDGFSRTDRWFLNEIDCLRTLQHICTDVGHMLTGVDATNYPDANDYAVRQLDTPQKVIAGCTWSGDLGSVYRSFLRWARPSPM